MRLRGGRKPAHRPFVSAAWNPFPDRRLIDLSVTLGQKSWGLFYSPADVAKDAFNLAYHLKQDISATMALPSRYRRKMWELTLEQYEWERNQKPEAR